MDSLIFWIGVFAVSLIALVIASDKFIESAEKIGHALKIDPFIIGVTLVALGTSLPELISSIIAVMKGSSEIVIGNVIGSNITNISLIMGFIAVSTRRIDVSFDVIKVEMPILLSSAFIISIMMIDLKFDLIDGITVFTGLILFLLYTLRDGKDQENDVEKEETKLPFAAFIVFLLSGVAIYLSADYNIRSIINISNKLSIGKEVISLTAVSLGTSLPELLVSIAAAKKGNLKIAVGNIIGSNIFNSFAVLGIPSMISVLEVPPEMLTFSVPVMIALTMLFFVMMLSQKVNRWQGWMLILFYLFFLVSNIRTVL